MAYVYILKCNNNSYYTGFSTDIERRLKEHFFGEEMCARHTLKYGVESVEIVWETPDKTSALKLEKYIKSLTVAKKEDLITNPHKLGINYATKLNSHDYKVIQVQSPSQGGKR